MPYRLPLYLCLFFGVLLTASIGSARIQPFEIPWFFISNNGQSPASVRYSLETGVWGAEFLNTGIAWVSRKAKLHMNFVGATAAWQGFSELPGRINFFYGADPQNWHPNVPTWESLIARDLYPGIDLTYSAAHGKLKSEYLIRAGGNVKAIRLRYDGARQIRIDANGDLVIRTEGAEFREQHPVAWQFVDGQRAGVRAAFVLHGDEVGFRVGPYDASAGLVIDPALTYSTYLGGSGFTAATGIAVDGSGNAYVTGWTETRDIPSHGQLPQSNPDGTDVFVAKLGPAGNSIAYVTYLGGMSDDGAFAIAVDNQGNAVLTGETHSTDWPTLGALQNALAGTENAFAVRLDPSGNVVFSTYLGGSASDSGNAIALDSFGSAYIAGVTSSINFPVLTPYQAANSGGQDAFVAKLSSSGTLLYSTYLGGSGNDQAYGIAVDNQGQAAVTGGTFSTNFPTINALQSSNLGGENAFVEKLYAAGNGLAFSTYLGGSGGTPIHQEQGNAIALDSAGNIHIAGVTSSPDFPSANAFQSSYGGGSDAFVAEIGPSGATLLYSSYLGGGSMDWATGIAIDALNQTWIAGYTSSVDFPQAAPIQAQLNGGFDGFLTYVGAGGQLLFSSWFGGSKMDSIASIALGVSNSLYAAGLTQSTNLATLNPVQPVNYSGYSALVAKLTQCSYSLSQTAINAGGAPSSGGITVTTSSGCTFAAASNVGWATVGVSGSTVTWSVPGNSGVQRSGILTIAGQNVTIVQAGNCSYSLSQMVISVGPGASAGGIAVTPSDGSCPVTATSNAAWASVSFSGNTVVWSVSANSGPQRAGTLTIAGQAVTITQLAIPTMTLTHNALNVGTNSVLITVPQSVVLDFSSSGNTSWTASSNQPNITVSPSSGAGNSTLQITASPGASGVVTVSAPGAINSPLQITVNIATVVPAPPFGNFDTPANGTTGIAGAIAVTGWALDNIAVTKVDIWREPVGAEPTQSNGLIYIADAVFINDARPDVFAAYPKLPLNYRGGWGYMMLTNFLPNNGGSPGPGNGTYKLHAIAHDQAGFSLDLGTHTITCDNVHASKPFGTIDTPGQGATVSGTIANFGWALTQNPYVIPADGSTIFVTVDGVTLGHPVYNNYRQDIAGAFPGLANTNGAVGYFILDTTTLANGRHTIGWLVYDNAGRGDGIGSRFFFVNNP